MNPPIVIHTSLLLPAQYAQKECSCISSSRSWNDGETIRTPPQAILAIFIGEAAGSRCWDELLGKLAACRSGRET